MEMDWQPVWLSLKLASVTTVLLLLIGTPLAWWLSQTRSFFKQPIAAIIALPLVLPSTVLGFYLLLLLGPQGAVGQFMQRLGLDTLPFTFAGLVVASIFYSLPFMVQPLQNAFENLGKKPLEIAATLRASPFDTFMSVVVPLARPGFITGIVLCFAHTIGEFGVILMIGGNIPGETQVLSIAIYDHVEMLEYGQAHILSAGMVLFSFVVLLTLFYMNRRTEVRSR
ncbi:MAG: molybdate ABC transporter permease subunit [Gammaproteobacteria bacterium]|nr:molybdate ABC transporter permease subunit [Gammaproteobacteria bacterium]MCF6230004.1 molybdate ABC transporter permease subunit [Gammaproteobacteria bacterium]